MYHPHWGGVCGIFSQYSSRPNLFDPPVLPRACTADYNKRLGFTGEEFKKAVVWVKRRWHDPNASLSVTVDGEMLKTISRRAHPPILHPNEPSGRMACSVVLVFGILLFVDRVSLFYHDTVTCVRSVLYIFPQSIGTIIVTSLCWLLGGRPHLPELLPFIRDDSIFRPRTPTALATRRHPSANSTMC
ncbi:hypothetical protein EDB87DRAFT_1339680 [Lactarius vividus]|nr:hypothetical protein EDB87DRAFT_1339680 [Lactarius vividus]